MSLRLLLSILLVYRSNFHVLHWNAKGCRFDEIHNISSEYYEKLLEDADAVAEMLMCLGKNVVNYSEAYDLLKDYKEHDFAIIASDITYGFDDFTKLTGKMFKDILTAIEAVLESEELKSPFNIGIKATLEGMHGYYDLRCRYINSRRME